MQGTAGAAKEGKTALVLLRRSGLQSQKDSHLLKVLPVSKEVYIRYADDACHLPLKYACRLVSHIPDGLDTRGLLAVPIVARTAVMQKVLW